MAGGVTRTLRLDEELDGALQRKARNERVSVNFLATKAIRKYIEWDSFRDRLGFTDASLPAVSGFVEEIDDDKLVELGRRVAKDLKPIVQFLYGESSVDSTVSFIRTLALYGDMFSFEDAMKKGKRVLVLKHPSGKKWSKYYSAILEGLFRDQLGKQVEIHSTDDLCVVEFPPV